MAEIARVTVVTAADKEPVDLATAKDHLRVGHTTDDALIERLIRVAREWVEAYTGLTLVSQTVDLTYDAAADTLELPTGPVQSITSVTAYDTAGTGTALSASVYSLDAVSVPPRLYVTSWPSGLRTYNAVVVRAVVGYSSVDAIPGICGQALLLVLAELYERREQVVEGVGALTGVPLSAERLLAFERRYLGVA